MGTGYSARSSEILGKDHAPGETHVDGACSWVMQTVMFVNFLQFSQQSVLNRQVTGQGYFRGQSNINWGQCPIALTLDTPFDLNPTYHSPLKLQACQS